MFVGGKSVEVVGIVKTAKYMRWDEAPRPFLYLPYSDNYVPRMTLHVEASTDAFAAVRALARSVPASDARPLQEYFDNGAMFGVKIALKIAGIVGTGGLLLALAGLYGVVACSARRRRREVGIRLALGATPSGVVKLIAREAVLIAACGTVAGLLLAASGSRLLRSFVPGSGQSAWSSAVAAVAMALACLIASAVPALRALRVDPAKVLREE
jgi:ABC-type lipoprotein release transport system permease subunit